MTLGMDGGWVAALLLGLLQGVAEWLPVSSEGMVAAVYSLVYGGSLGEGVEYALWLHAGTMPAVLVVLRGDAVAVVRNVLTAPTRLSSMAAFWVWATIISGVIGLPLLLLVTGRGDNIAGPWVMVLIGVALLVTAAAQLLRSGGGERERDSTGRVDALLAGLAQGVSVIPGFSRSGLTAAALLARGFQGRDALALSFLMSVPASLGAALYVGVSSGVAFSLESLIDWAGGGFRVGVVDYSRVASVGGLAELWVVFVGGGRCDVEWGLAGVLVVCQFLRFAG